jgi:hypothetical protein
MKDIIPITTIWKLSEHIEGKDIKIEDIGIPLPYLYVPEEHGELPAK